jgi:methyl coenzyme M reductase alpha subunit
VGLESFEAPGVETVFPKKDQAIDYAQSRACFRSGEIRIFDSRGNVARIIPFGDTIRKLRMP